MADRVVIENRLAAKGEVTYRQTPGSRTERRDGGHERQSTRRKRFQDHPL
jgi:hypothetical protein